MSAERFVPLVGSQQSPLPGAEPVAASDQDEQLTVSVYLRPGSTAGSPVGQGQKGKRFRSDRSTVSRPGLNAQSGADPDLSAVARWASGCGLLVVRKQNPAIRMLRLAGPARAFSQAFGVQLQMWRCRGQEYRDRIGVLFVPESLSDIVETVLGLALTAGRLSGIRTRANLRIENLKRRLD